MLVSGVIVAAVPELLLRGALLEPGMGMLTVLTEPASDARRSLLNSGLAYVTGEETPLVRKF